MCKSVLEALNFNANASYSKWLRMGVLALARVAQFVGRPPAKQKVAGSLPGQVTCFSPWSGRVQEATHECFSLTWMFLSHSPSLPSLSLKTNTFKKKSF